jgi:hypothetical protein
MDEPFDYDQLDPGVRELVRALHRLGWETSDSGDGVSKSAEWYTSGEALPFAHVVVACNDPRTMLDEAHRLRGDLPDGWEVEASYATDSGIAVLFARTGNAYAGRVM